MSPELSAQEHKLRRKAANRLGWRLALAVLLIYIVAMFLQH